MLDFRSTSIELSLLKPIQYLSAPEREQRGIGLVPNLRHMHGHATGGLSRSSLNILGIPYQSIQTHRWDTSILKFHWVYSIREIQGSAFKRPESSILSSIGPYYIATDVIYLFIIRAAFIYSIELYNLDVRKLDGWIQLEDNKLLRKWRRHHM